MEFIIVSLVIGYFVGCIQPSYIISKIKKTNIKELGSKNAGASNITLVFGWKYGVIVALIDIFKPIVSMALIWHLFHSKVQPDFLMILYYINGATVVIGHIFPFFMKFNGGKGTASTIGLFFVINWKIALLALILLVLLTILTNYIVIGGLALHATFLIYTWLEQFEWITLTTAILLACLFCIKHMENFIRITKGEETGLRSVMNKKNQTGANM